MLREKDRKIVDYTMYLVRDIVQRRDYFWKDIGRKLPEISEKESDLIADIIEVLRDSIPEILEKEN